MGVINQPKQVTVSTGLSSAELSAATTTDDESGTSGQATPVPGPRRPGPLCPSLLSRGLGRHAGRLREGRGRRTQHRCDNEKMLMAMYGIDFDSGEDIPQQGRSYFLDLLQQDNEELLEQFINEEEPKFFNKEKRNKRKRGEEAEEAQFEPEDAFLKISSSLRQALKHQLPLGMLQGIEDRLHQTFSRDPHSEYVAEGLSSFERLLLHAACAYYALNSHSFDFGSQRLVRVENPWGRYAARDPRLHQYLLIRAGGP